MKFYELINPAAVQTVKYAERLLKDISTVPCAMKPVVGETAVALNHPVFTFGHLGIYPLIMARLLSLPTAKVEESERYFDLFKIGSPCVDDPNGTIYPGLDVVTKMFFEGMDYLITSLANLDEDVLKVPLEDPGRRERFGSVGPFVAYLLTAHPMTHLGQISAWRRCMGLAGV